MRDPNVTLLFSNVIDCEHDYITNLMSAVVTTRYFGAGGAKEVVTRECEQLLGRWSANQGQRADSASLLVLALARCAAHVDHFALNTC